MDNSRPSEHLSSDTGSRGDILHRPFEARRVELIVTPGETRKRLDLFLAHRDPALSRSALQRLIEDGCIRLNDRPAKPSQKIKPGDCIVLEIPRPAPLDLKPEPIPLEILEEDEALVVLNKPVGLVVHPAPGHWSGTLVNALLHHFTGPDGTLSSIGGKERPGLVHRLDKETSGVMVVAKTDQAHHALAAQFKEHSITREYEALVWGAMKKTEGLIELAIGRDLRERKKFSARTARPRPSATVYRVLERYGALASRVALFPRTGRTHQLRVHLNSIDHPILGDPTYGGKKVRRLEQIEIPRVMLHARTLGFQHPRTGAYREFSAPTPLDMEQVIAALREISTVTGQKPS
ncbi:MAG: RluA family pseudouridine synthase [Nitrospirae bacterium]|nr:RluA family pseudouridine synthase [Nitrospirota bacterium]